MYSFRLKIPIVFKLEGLLLPQQEYENNMETSSTFKGSSEEKECKIESVENIITDNNVAQDRSLKVLNESIEASNSEVESKFLELVCLKDNIYTCTICEMTMNHKGSMRRHLETHLTGLSYECSWCAQVFNTRMQLANHKRIHNKYTLDSIGRGSSHNIEVGPHAHDSKTVLSIIAKESFDVK